MNKQQLITSVLLTFTSLVWAGSFVAVKIGVREISPIDLGFLRFFVATPIMFLLLFSLKKKRNVRIPLKELPKLAALGLTGVTLLYLFQFTGINYTTAATSAVLINTNVVFIALLSALVLKEVFSLKKTTGIILSFSGVIIVIFSQMSNEYISFNTLFLVGCLLILISAFCWALYSIIGKTMLSKYDSLTVTTYAFALGTLFYLPFVLPQLFSTIQHISVTTWLVIFYLALVCSVFAYMAWYYALSHTEASKVAVFLNFIPLFSIILSYLILGETLTFLFLVGAMLIIYGVYLTQRG